MTQEDLLAARPAIRKTNYAGTTVPRERPHNSWDEELTAEAWPYRHARYDVAGGVLVGVQLTGYPKPAELRAARLTALAPAKALWGAAYAAELTGGFTVSPVLVWAAGDREVRLTLPPDVPAKPLQASPMITLGLRLASNRSVPESEIVLPAAERARLFEECGVEDRRPKGTADLGVDELRAAPDSIVLDGRTVVLSVRLERDYRDLRAGEDGRPLSAVFSLHAQDGKPFPVGVRFERAWIRRGRELWRIPSLEDAPVANPAFAPERRASAKGGPRWPADEADAVVRVIGRDGPALLLGARRQRIIAVGFPN